jgi:hypothetical protein
MTAYVITIGTGRAHNWKIAQDNALWATPKAYGIALGDDLFFWQSGVGLVAHWRATADESVVDDPASLPWPDSVDMHYTREFPMVEVGTVAEPVAPWKRVGALIGTNAGPNLGVIRVTDPAGRDRLAALFTATSGLSAAEAVLAAEAERAAIASDEDARRFVERAIVARQGQPEFRESLIIAWDGRCAITGCDAQPALEAAHVRPYLGTHTNTLGNGLLLRADVHTLFDRLLITIDPNTWTVRLASELQRTSYRYLDGVAVSVPGQVPRDELSRALATHRDQVLASRPTG